MTSHQPQPMPFPEIKEVSWESRETEYHAIRLTGTLVQTIAMVDMKLESLVINGSKPTVIISSHSGIARVRSLFLPRLINGRISLDIAGMPTVALQVDRRINGGLIYILYEDAEPRAIEAVEFEGLTTLP